MTLVHIRIETPINPLLLVADDDHLYGIWFHTSRHPMPPHHGAHAGDNAVLRETRAQLKAYFAGDRRGFDLPLRPEGTPFQQDVWAMLAEIPYGETWTYGDVARRIGRPDAVRAVGAANGRNPIPIVLPCHRVIGADGSLTGFGGGLPTKQYLLELEGALRKDDLFA
jgi:methylated-DNA-[protein]-cysteine S-methyltransferase